MSVDQSNENFEHPLFDYMEKVPGADIGLTTADKVLSWGMGTLSRGGKTKD